MVAPPLQATAFACGTRATSSLCQAPRPPAALVQREPSALNATRVVALQAATCLASRRRPTFCQRTGGSGDAGPGPGCGWTQGLSGSNTVLRGSHGSSGAGSGSVGSGSTIGSGCDGSGSTIG